MTIINNAVIVGQFVPKKNAIIISIGLAITVLIISQIILRTSCKNIFEKSKLKKYCKHMISNKLIHFATLYLIITTFVPIIHNIMDRRINRSAYLTLDWFEKYIEKMSKYNLKGSNFNIHARI